MGKDLNSNQGRPNHGNSLVVQWLVKTPLLSMQGAQVQFLLGSQMVPSQEKRGEPESYYVNDFKMDITESTKSEQQESGIGFLLQSALATTQKTPNEIGKFPQKHPDNHLADLYSFLHFYFARERHNTRQVGRESLLQAFCSAGNFTLLTEACFPLSVCHACLLKQLCLCRDPILIYQVVQMSKL